MSVQSKELSGDQREPNSLKVFGGGGSGEATLLQKGPSPENSFSYKRLPLFFLPDARPCERGHEDELESFLCQGDVFVSIDLEHAPEETLLRKRSCESRSSLPGRAS